MRRFFQNIIVAVSDIGLDPSTSASERIKTKILNQQVFITLVAIFFFIVKSLYDGDHDVVFIIGVLLITSTIMVFQYLRKFLVARLQWTLFYPSLMTIAAILYGEELHLDVTYLVSTLTAIMLFEKRWYRISTVSYIISLYFFQGYYLSHTEPTMALPIDQMERSAVFLTVMFCVAVIIVTYLNENTKNNKELNKLLTELGRKNIRLLSAYNDIERFTYISSHNLKTPVRTIRSFADLLERNIKAKRYDELEENLGFVRQGADEINLLLTSILNYSKFNSTNKLEIEAVDLNEIVEDVKIQLEAIHSSPFKIQTQGLRPILSNQNLLNVLCFNLMENAIKFNESALPLLSLTMVEEEQHVSLIFKDNGIGIEDKYRSKVFEIFQRLHTCEAYNGGAGIGLAIARKIVQLLNGSIYIFPSEDPGTTLVVKLPKDFEKSKQIGENFPHRKSA